MFPYIGPISTTVYLYVLVAILACAILFTRFGRTIGKLKLLVMILAVSFAGLVGSRILHVVWERPDYFLEHPLEAFTRIDGMVFYGALAAGIATFMWIAKTYFKNARDNTDLWDLASLCAALTVGILRLGCFAGGCCWGAPTSVPWAVRYYHPKSVMPWIGIPVHPTQLYDSFVGFSMAIVFAYVYLTGKPELMRGRLCYFFGMGYGLGRFTTEFFRGDSFRGADVALSLSTSQILSIGFFALSLAFFIRSLPRKEVALA